MAACASMRSFAQAIRESRPKAALVAHLCGWGSARLLELRALCREQGVVLIEDGAQAFGVRYQGEPIYKGAHISTSFYPAKVLGPAGDGGAVFTDDAELADKVRRLGNHGRTAHYGYGDVGWNSRLDFAAGSFPESVNWTISRPVSYSPSGRRLLPEAPARHRYSADERAGRL